MFFISVLYPDLPLTSFPSNETDVFQNMLNISANDVPLIRQYQQALQDENFELAQQILTQIPAYSQKLLTAEKLNKIGQATTAVERFYKTDVQPYIGQKQQEWQSIINQFNYYGVWNPSAQYVPNNFVQYQVIGVNYLFIATSLPTIGTVPTDTNYWRQLTIRGTKGNSGVGMAFMFEWESSTNYITQDIVSYQNGLWGAIAANTNQPPYEGSQYWQLIFKGEATIYPVQSTQPIGQNVGDLWFKIV